MDDMITDGFGMALGLGEEIAIDERSGEMSQIDDGVLGSPVKELTPIVKVDTPQKLVDLTDMNNWLVPMSKKLRSPFIEKWKRVALGLKDPGAPLLTYEEEHAYHMADIDVDDGDGSEKMMLKLKELRKASIKARLKNMVERIAERRQAYDKNQNDGEKGI